ncbi:PREDICTED: AN1-type zinc finger protein 4 [Nanorana parkeri]|uniref:AN1-type zinc finger protein 4 n=1 Tax=Nanorana parkeri TaxID=125878 RepID=UPI00085476A3|nr:PREDICTED: AN1-type zinc finger protein 4 [Nanorana parkeri]XP_018425759.1 PREDICTED: AN1-type zinc finger protein 4 [Nanorana parkeri]
MTHKKEPPFFNEDKDGSLLCKGPFTMELFIETLTGTCFELRVSPFETVACVKAKIQRLEGIPITQQHLIWNNIDLKDDVCLNDYMISEGCTLKLVLAMRAGPINTRRVPLEDPIRELAELVDPVQDEMQEKLSSNKQVTFLVYRDGDQMNFFRVVDKRNVTLTPLSEYLRGGSANNLYAEDDDDDDDIEASPSADQIIDNSITRIKMKLLKSKMESMDLNKKLRRSPILKPRPPMAPRPSNGSMVAGRYRLLKVLPHIGQTCLPPGNLHAAELSHNALSTLTAAASTLTVIAGDGLKEEETSESSAVISSLASITFPTIVSPVELENSQLSTNTTLPHISSLPKKYILTKDDDSILHSNLNIISPEETSRTGTECFALLTDVGSSEQYDELCSLGKVKSEFELAEAEKEAPTIETHKTTVPNALNSDLMETGILNATDVSPPRNKFLSPIHIYSPINDNVFPKTQQQPKCFDLGSLRPPASHNLFHSLQLRSLADPTFSRTSRFRGVGVESPRKRSSAISKVEASDMTEVANKSSQEPVGSLNNLRFFASLARSGSRENSQFRTVVAPSACLQNENLSSLNDKGSIFITSHGLGESEANADFGKKMVEATHLFPPVKPAFRNKKKTTKHCFLCRKRTNLATSFECRCGNNFCATHRYAETHNCTYDYKTAGRRHLQEANPVVTAPKLPKI